MRTPNNGAIISKCGLYRYQLWRQWDNRPMVVFIMLNPSTADTLKDDATIRKCVGFAKLWHMGGVCVVNLFAFRATDPRDMMEASDPVGPENEEHLRRVCADANQDDATIICAWGANGFHMGQDQTVLGWLNAWRVEPMALRLTSRGQPGHPLYIPYEATPFEFRKGPALLEFR